MKLNELKQLFAEDRAVSPVVGVALLIAITVILAAVIGGVVLGIGTGGAETPQAQLSADFGDDNVTISHNGGEPLDADEVVVLDEDDEELTTFDGLTAGQSTDVGDGSETEATVIWQDPDSSSETVLAEFEE